MLVYINLVAIPDCINLINCGYPFLHIGSLYIFVYIFRPVSAARTSRGGFYAGDIIPTVVFELAEKESGEAGHHKAERVQ